MAASFVFAAASAAVYGYTFARSLNQVFYLPSVLAALDSSLFPADPVLQALRSAPTFFWNFLAQVSALIGLERACFWLWFLGRVAAGFLTYKTARLLGATPAAAALSLGLALPAGDLFTTSALAGDPMFKADLDQTSFAWPLVLLAIALWIAGRRVLSLVSLGLLANFNLMLSPVTAVWLCLSSLLREPRDFKKLVAGTAAYFLAAVPILWRLFGRGLMGDIGILLVCTPQSYLTSHWPPEKWIRAGGQIFLLTCLFLKLPSAGRLFALLIAALFVWMINALAGFIPSLHWLLSFQFFRLDVAVLWLGLACAGQVLLPRLARREADRFLAALAAAWTLAYPLSAPLLLVWAGLLLLFEENRRVRMALGLVGAFYGTIALCLPPDSLWGLFPTTALILLILASLAAATAAGCCERPLGAGVRGLVLAMTGVLALLPLLEAAFLWRCEPKRPAVTAAEIWARAKPPDTLFIVAPGYFGFRFRSRRPVYAEWTDFALATWDSSAAQGWMARMAELGVDWRSFQAAHGQGVRDWEASLLRRAPGERPAGFQSWGPGDAARLAALAGRVKAGYIVAPAQSQLPFPVLFRSDEMLIYAAR